jgi:CheY-like chemotaxis protein
MDLAQFRNSLKDILNHLADTAYLENSKLANLLLSDEESKQGNRIQLLRSKISTGIEVLRPPEDIPVHVAEWRCYRILTLRYLRGMELYLIEDELGLSQRQVQRDLKKGIDALASILWEQFKATEGISEPDESVSSAASDSYDLELIKKELRNWEITFDLFNLGQIVEQALQLCESLLKTNLRSHVDQAGVDPHIDVRVDQILTKQGLYKVLSMAGSGVQDATIVMQTRRLNEFFIELSIEFNHHQPLNLNNWEIAQLFYTIQGVNHKITQLPQKTTITITLPLMQQNSCLVIDDVVSVRRLVERMLGSYGIQVFGLEDAEEALTLAQLMKPDFILLDILMPKVDGWQMIKQLKSHPDTSSIPVIICSVLYEPELSRAVGAEAYIRKPINRLELIRTLQELRIIESDEKDAQ